MLAVIEGFTLPRATSAAVCEACHARVASPATKRNVNMHANTGYPLPTATTQGRLEALFTLPECVQCHDPHGMTANGTGYNIYMVPSTITVVPGATPTVVPNVRFENLTGRLLLQRHARVGEPTISASSATSTPATPATRWSTSPGTAGTTSTTTRWFR